MPAYWLVVLGLIAFLAAPAGSDESLAYINLIERRIMAIWRLPPNAEGRKVALRINLDAAGSISDVCVEDSSGDEAFDASAVEAVRRASPFPPVPISMKNLIGDLLMVLDPTWITKPGGDILKNTPPHILPAPRVPARPARPAPKKIPGQEI